MAGHSKQFERINERLDSIESQLGDLHDGMIASLGLSTHANVRSEKVVKDIEDLKKRVKRLEAKR